MRLNFFTTSLVIVLPLIVVISIIFNDRSVVPPQEVSSNEIASSTEEYHSPAEQPNSNKPDYNAPWTEEDKQDISYIINTLATKSGFSLLFEKNKLERAGKSTIHANTLQMLTYIFSDPELKIAVKQISGTAWQRFSKETAESLEGKAVLIIYQKRTCKIITKK